MHTKTVSEKLLHTVRGVSANSRKDFVSYHLLEMYAGCLGLKYERNKKQGERRSDTLTPQALTPQNSTPGRGHEPSAIAAQQPQQE